MKKQQEKLIEFETKIVRINIRRIKKIYISNNILHYNCKENINELV
jgi:hypothetical protein